MRLVGHPISLFSYLRFSYIDLSNYRTYHHHPHLFFLRWLLYKPSTSTNTVIEVNKWREILRETYPGNVTGERLTLEEGVEDWKPNRNTERNRLSLNLHYHTVKIRVNSSSYTQRWTKKHGNPTGTLFVSDNQSPPPTLCWSCIGKGRFGCDLVGSGQVDLGASTRVNTSRLGFDGTYKDSYFTN